MESGVERGGHANGGMYARCCGQGQPERLRDEAQRIGDQQRDAMDNGILSRTCRKLGKVMDVERIKDYDEGPMHAMAKQLKPRWIDPMAALSYPQKYQMPHKPSVYRRTDATQ